MLDQHILGMIPVAIMFECNVNGHVFCKRIQIGACRFRKISDIQISIVYASPTTAMKAFNFDVTQCDL